MPQEELPDLAELHAEAIANGYESSGIDKKQPPTLTYSGRELYQVEWVKMNQLGCSDGGRHDPKNQSPVKDTFRTNTFALVSVTTKDGSGKGDAYARSVAKILGLYEDQSGCCYVAVHYFWRWGQIHASYDRHSATRPSSPHQIFLQKEPLKKPMYNGKGMTRYTVTYEGSGQYAELISAVNLEMPVIVMHRQEAEQLPGGLQQYQLKYGRHTTHWDVTTDTPNNGFWFDSTFDQSAYLFEECDTDGRTVPAHKLERVRQKELTMLDAFCGCGTVSVAANTVGITVVGGIDFSADAISSYTANTMSVNGCNFNASRCSEPLALHMPVKEFVKKVKSGDLQLEPIKLLHASPPCQNVSRKKKAVDRVMEGTETLAIAELVEVLQPVYVTLEEVPGYVVQSFQRHNMQGPLRGWPTPSPDDASKLSVNDDQELNQSSGDLDDLDACSCDDDEEEEEEEFASASASGATPSSVGTKSSRRAADNGEVAFSSIAMLVSKLVGMQYSVELGILQAVDYQVPQQRERLVMMATKHGYHQAHLPDPWCQRPPNYRQQPLPATDPNLCIREEDAADWRSMLEVVPNQNPELPPHITIVEAIGDLPPLLTQSSVGKSLGRQVAVYDPCKSGAAVFRHPVPVDQLEGCEPVSRYSVFMRSPHTRQQCLRLGNVFDQNELRDHSCEHNAASIQKLLETPEDRPTRGQAAETAAEKYARVRAGRRRAGDGVAACVMGHNEPHKPCMHFLEDRLISILERRRFQSLPDWLRVEGDRKSREQQIGNAVPYLMGVAIMGEVFAAATGKQAYRPPVLLGPCLEGSGVPASALQAYKEWVQQVEADEDEYDDDAEGGWHAALQECRRLLSAKAASIRYQQQQQYQLLQEGTLQDGARQQQQQQPLLDRPEQPALQRQQQPGCSSQTGSQQLQQKRLQPLPLPHPAKRMQGAKAHPASLGPQPTQQAEGLAIRPSSMVATA